MWRARCRWSMAVAQGAGLNPMVVLRSDRLDLRTPEARDAEFVKSLYANARVTRTLLRIQRPISIAQEFCRMTAEASGDHRFGAALHTDGTLIALGTVRRHTETGCR
jgi:hypothetical protein